MSELKTTPEVCGMGHSMKRKEDARFLRGQGKYTDDGHGHSWSPCGDYRGCS